MLIFSVSFQFYRMISEENPCVFWHTHTRAILCLEVEKLSSERQRNKFAEWPRRRPRKPTGRHDQTHPSHIFRGVGAGPGSVPPPGGGRGIGGTTNSVTLLDVCVPSLRRGHDNLLCIVPILSDDLRGESTDGQWPALRSSLSRCKHTHGTKPFRHGPGASKKLGNSSRFVRVILAQGPC